MEYLIKENVLYRNNNFLKEKISEDHFIINKKEEYAGSHILLDLWNTEFNNSIKFLKKIMRESIDVSGATLLHMHLHRFGKEQGISGVAILAESHISVHTWPERNFLAFDIFMCGDTKPELAAKYLIQTLNPKKKILKLIKRGVKKRVK